MATKRKLNNCQACERSDSYDNMVCCGHCNNWYHFKCAGVGPTITRFDWFCPICLTTFIETYQSAKTAEYNIVQNLDSHKSNENVNKRSRQAEDGSSHQRVAVHLERGEIVKMIEQTVASAFAKHFEQFQATVNAIGATVDADDATTNIQNADVFVDPNFETVNAELTIATVVLEPNVDGTIETTDEVTTDDATENAIPSIETLDAEINIENVLEPNVEATVDATNATSNAETTNSEGNIAAGGLPSVGAAGAEAIDEYLPVKNGQHSLLQKLEFDLENYVDHFRQIFKTNGAERLSTTMRVISNKIVEDALLKDYSYTGRRGDNIEFGPFKNIKDLICLATMDAYNIFNGKEITIQEVEIYFRTTHIRLAKQRYGRHLNKK